VTTEISIAERTALLNQIQRMVNEGMCVSAMVMARDRNVQFNADTLRSWAKDQRKTQQYRHRKTYAWLARSAAPITVPAPAKPATVTSITTPVVHPLSMPRRPWFVRRPSKVA